MATDDVQCTCCRIFYASEAGAGDPIYAPLHRTLGMCRDCRDHQGEGDTVRFNRGLQHGRMLRAAYEADRARVAAAQQEVKEMQRELNMRPVQKVITIANLDAEIVETARRERAEAERRRDTAMGALSDVRLLHHKERVTEKCVCGLPYDRCAAAALVDRWDGVLWWERSEAGKAWRGERHRLKQDHPALTERDYLDGIYGSPFEG